MSNFVTKIHPGKFQPVINSAITEISKNQIIHRIWNKDHTVWKPEPTEITNRLGWLDIGERIQVDIDRMTSLRDTLLNEGYEQVLLLGMGGSSLAPEVFSKTSLC